MRRKQHAYAFGNLGHRRTPRLETHPSDAAATAAAPTIGAVKNYRRARIHCCETFQTNNAKHTIPRYTCTHHRHKTPPVRLTRPQLPSPHPQKHKTRGDLAAQYPTKKKNTHARRKERSTRHQRGAEVHQQKTTYRRQARSTVWANRGDPARETKSTRAWKGLPAHASRRAAVPPTVNAAPERSPYPRRPRHKKQKRPVGLLSRRVPPVRLPLKTNFSRWVGVSPTKNSSLLALRQAKRQEVTGTWRNRCCQSDGGDGGELQAESRPLRPRTVTTTNDKHAEIRHIFFHAPQHTVEGKKAVRMATLCVRIYSSSAGWPTRSERPATQAASAPCKN